ncbi:MAG: DUF2147 domain-containing protein [Bacteroidetes bacterium]|nr:DUF2147 domain-containing protein [Bacteroidota bacterium]
MKYFFWVVIILSMTSFKKANDNSGDKIIGKWVASKEKNLVVRIFRSGVEFKATIVWFDDSDDKSHPMNIRIDTRNPDKSLRTRKIIGLEVLTGLIYNEKEKQWQNGHIYDPSSGKTYCAKAWLTNDSCLKVRGFWHFEFLGQTMCFIKTL